MAGANHAASASLGLADVLAGAPSVLDFLSNADLKALLSTSSALRQLLHGHVKKLHVPASYPCELDTQLPASGSWCGLEQLDLSYTDLDTKDLKQLQKVHLPNLRHLDVSGNTLRARAVKYLSKGCWPNLQSLAMGHSNLLVSPAAGCLCNSNWPLLTSLQLPGVGMIADAMAKLTEANWPSLQHLDLSCNDLDCHTLSLIAAGKWHGLRSLNLSGNTLKPRTIDSLVTGCWPLLEALELQDCKLRLEYIPKLLAGQWPKLQSLNLARNTMWADSAPVLWFPCNGLKQLDLANTGLTYISQNVLQSWCSLEYLSLSWNQLHGSSIDYIFNGGFSRIKGLALRYIDSVWRQMSDRAVWPLIEVLDLSSSGLVIRNSHILCGGQWPHLRSLYLADTGFNICTAEALSKAKWTKLEVLNLDENNIAPDEMWGCIDFLLLAQWPMQHFSIRGNGMNTEALLLLLEKGWQSLVRLSLPSALDYNSICAGTVWVDPVQLYTMHVSDVRVLVKCALPHLARLTFSGVRDDYSCW